MSVESDGAGGLGERDVDGFGAGESGGFEVRGEGQRVVLRKNGVGEALGLCDGGCDESATGDERAS